MSLIKIENDALTVVISTLGAEMQSIKDVNGIERLWQGNDQFWIGRAPILFPIAGGLKDDCYLLGERRFPMPKHGYVRSLEWVLESADAESAVFLMVEKAEGFPFDYELRVCYTLDGNSLKVTYRVSNLDDCAFVFGMGAHEGYATPGGIEQYSILFDEHECLSNYVLHGNLIAHEPVILSESTNELTLKTEYFAKDALVLLNLNSRGVTLVNKMNDRKIRVDYPQHDVLLLWSKPDAEYICIEPWLNAPDFVDSDMRIENKDGCIRLEPQATVERYHVITMI